MGLSEYKEDLFVRYNHFLNKRITFKQKTSFIRSLMVEFQKNSSDIKVVELRETGKRTSLARNVYVGDVKTADVIIATYYDSPLVHLGPYYILNKKKQRNGTLLFNVLVSSVLLLLGVIFTLQVTNKYLSKGFDNIRWDIFIGVGLVYMILTYLIGMFSKGVGRKRNVIRNNSTVIYMIDKILQNHEISKKVAYAFLDSGTTNERGLYGLKESVKKNSKIIYLDSIGATQQLQYIYENSGEFKSVDDSFKEIGVYRVFCAQYNNQEYFLDNQDLNPNIHSTVNSEIVDKIIDKLLK